MTADTGTTAALSLPGAGIDAANAAERRARLAAIALMCGAVACFAGLDACGKYLSRSLPVLEVVWARYALSALMTLAVINPWTSPGVFVTRRPLLQFLRSTFLLVSTIVNLIAVGTLISERPPHRTVRAEFPHTAPTSGV